ncbi:diacylglycerol kinase 1-like protein, partial [Tanacetum coccineum]
MSKEHKEVNQHQEDSFNYNFPTDVDPHMLVENGSNMMMIMRENDVECGKDTPAPGGSVNGFSLSQLENARSMMDRMLTDYPWKVQVIVDGVDVEVLEDVEGVLIANIGSYMGGVDLWQNENHNNDNFDPQSMHDKRLEVVSISGSWHLEKLQVLDVTTGVLIDEYMNMMLWVSFWACIVEALEGSCNDALSCVLDFHGDMACHL